MSKPKLLVRIASFLAGVIFVAAVGAHQIGCSSSSQNAGPGGEPGSAVPSTDTGSIGLALSLPGGEIVNNSTYTVTGPNGASTVVSSGTLNLQNSQTLSFTIGGIPAGSGYAVSVSGTTTDGLTTCAGQATFSVTARATTNVAVLLQCLEQAPDVGTVAINGQPYDCAVATSLSALPSETTLGNSVALTAMAVGPASSNLVYSWSAPTGTFSSQGSANTNYTCTAAGVVTVTATVSDGPVPDGGACNVAMAQVAVSVQCDLVPGSPSACALGASGAIKHVIYVQFDNTHLYQDTYGRPPLPNNVPSDLEQMPHLLNFIRNNGTMMADDHTILISHTAGGILTSLTGVYPDRHGQTVTNSYERTTSTGSFTFPSSYQYWTDSAYSNTSIPNMVTPTGANAPAPWVSFTRAGCNVGAVGIANMEIENNNDYSNGDIAEIFGTNSAAYQEAVTAWNAPYPTAASTISATDFEGIAIHCAYGSSVCASGEPDSLPAEPGGYTGFFGLFGAKQINPLLIGQDGGTPVPDGGVALTDLLGNAITDSYGQPGFPGFDGMTAAVSLSYVANMQEHGVPVTYAYISDAHDNHGLDGSGQTPYGPGAAGYTAQLQAYDQAFENFFNRLSNDGINSSNTLFIFTVDEGDHFVGGNPSPTNCDGSDTPCVWASNQIGEVDLNIDQLMNNEFPSVASQFAAQDGLNSGAPNAYTVHGDDAPTFYLSRVTASDAGATGALSQTDPNTRAFERAVAQATATNPYTGNTDSLLYRMVDQTGMAAIHMITTGDPVRNPTFVYFADDDYFITDYPSSTCADCLDTGYAWNHGDDQSIIGMTWQGWVGPGVQVQPQTSPPSDNTTVWTDHTDLRPTMDSILGLTDDYMTDGRVITEILSSSDYNSALSANLSTTQQLGQAYKSITSPFNAFGQCVIGISTVALQGSDSNDATYTSLESQISSMVSTQQSLISSIRSALWSAEFSGTAISTSQAQTWITSCQNLVSQCQSVLSGALPDGGLPPGNPTFDGGSSADASGGVDATVGADASATEAGAGDASAGQNIAVYRVGDGTIALSGNGNPVFIDEFTPTGTLVQSFEMPTAPSGTQHALIAAGTSTAEGELTLSSNGSYLLLTGYNATYGGDAGSLSSSSVLRVVGRMDGFGNIDTSTAPSDFATGGSPRTAVSPDGVNLFIGGSVNGIRYTTFGNTGTSTELSTTVTNIRQANIFGGQLYISDASGSAIRVGSVGSGLPQTSGQTMTNLPGFETSTGTPYGYYFTTLNGGTGPDTLYVCDDNDASTSPNPGLTKYALVGGNWTVVGTLAGTATGSYRGLTGVTNGTTATLYATANGATLVSVVDSAGYNEPINGTATTIATAAANTAYRGVAFFP